MPLWDSVHKGLEKASQEAARIARIQRLRATADGLSRQMQVQDNFIVNTVMELFLADKLTQSELLPFCQALAQLNYQLNQTQAEIVQIQAGQPVNQPPGTTPQSGEYVQSTAYAPPPLEALPYPSQQEEPGQAVYAPPPPEYQGYAPVTPVATPAGIESLSSAETAMMNPALPQIAATEKSFCPVCRAELAPNFAFCQQCGAHVQDVQAQSLPTMRAGMADAPTAERFGEGAADRHVKEVDGGA